jgi:sortase A
MVERAAWAIGLVALLIWGLATLAGTVGARRELERFESIRAARAPQPAVLPPTTPSDLRLWDVRRVRAWRSSLTQPAPPPLAILRIPKIGLEVAVLSGTSDSVLNRGVGHIADTALPGADSNSGIAGHRDGFFRGLKDIAAGDAIELETLDGRQMYRVERTWIVNPDDFSVLDPTPSRALTLVTCYPFYSIGSAPKRFIVRATRADTS